MDALGDIVPNDEPPTDPRGVVKYGVVFVVSSSLSENRLIKCLNKFNKSIRCQGNNSQ